MYTHLPAWKLLFLPRQYHSRTVKINKVELTKYIKSITGNFIRKLIKVV